MKILEVLIDSIEKTDAPVKEVRRGLHWTAVISRFCGLSSTMTRDFCSHEEQQADAMGSLTDMTAFELARLSLSENITEASLGLAALNSLIGVDIDKCVNIDGLELAFKIGGNKNISVIGHFPFVERLGKVAKNLWVIEKHPGLGDYPEDTSRDYLPMSDIIVISGTTLINHTLPSILALCPEGSVKILLGPTTPMATALFDYGIDALAGSTVINQQALLKEISEGANFRRLKKTGCVRYVTMVKNKEGLMPT
jgi:uncharacterized protein (DUF4213/DUF364 family)